MQEILVQVRETGQEGIIQLTKACTNLFSAAVGIGGTGMCSKCNGKYVVYKGTPGRYATAVVSDVCETVNKLQKVSGD